MNPDATTSSQDRTHAGATAAHVHDSPFIRAPEGAHTVFMVTVFAVCGPLLGGIVLFGWRAALVAALAITSCVVTELLYYRVTRIPALLGRSHAVLTGTLLALTLPAFVPWFVPVVAGAFAIIVGKAVFGGVGHFVWQPALVGRLAVAVMFPTLLTISDARFSHRLPVLAQNRLLVGDVREAAVGDDIAPWRGRSAPNGKDAFLLTSPTETLRGLTDRQSPAFSALVFRPVDQLEAKPAALLQMPPMENLFYGTRPGGLGETGIVLLIVACLYLTYRNYLKWELPLAMLLAAWVTVAVAPIYLAGPNNTVCTLWLPLLSPEGADTALTYISYQLLSGQLALAIVLASVEMTSRPVTTGGQVLFGLGCGTLAMLLQLYTTVPIPCLMAVLAMNTLTPTIDRFWRPRVFGTRHFAIIRGE
jgi:electron transport complex protein RnfD